MGHCVQFSKWPASTATPFTWSTEFIWLSSFIFKICASSTWYDRICRLDIRRRESSRNGEYFPDHSLMYERFRKEKIDLALKFVEFTMKQERFQIKPRNHEEAKTQGLQSAGNAGNGNPCATGMIDTNKLLWRFKMAQIWNRSTVPLTNGWCFGHWELCIWKLLFGCHLKVNHCIVP